MTDEDRFKAAREALQALDDINPLIELVRGLVAAFRNEGFTDAQAREIVAALFRSQGKGGPPRP